MLHLFTLSKKKKSLILHWKNIKIFDTDADHYIKHIESDFKWNNTST